MKSSLSLIYECEEHTKTPAKDRFATENTEFIEKKLKALCELSGYVHEIRYSLNVSCIPQRNFTSIMMVTFRSILRRDYI